jgi:threonine 3-dehydrogenase
MLHAAAQGEPLRCFVREEARIPFMAMPDAVRALLLLARAPREPVDAPGLQRYQLQPLGGKGARPRAGRLPAAQISFEPDLKREAIVDSWPADIDDSAARMDWGWAPEYDAESRLTPQMRKTVIISSSWSRRSQML